MDKLEAIEALKDGHAMYNPEYAKEICAALGVELRPGLVKPCYSDESGTFKGLKMMHEHEGMEAVDCLYLAKDIAETLGADTSVASRLYGRGAGARVYAAAIRAKLGL